MLEGIFNFFKKNLPKSHIAIWLTCAFIWVCGTIFSIRSCNYFDTQNRIAYKLDELEKIKTAIEDSKEDITKSIQEVKDNTDNLPETIKTIKAMNTNIARICDKVKLAPVSKEDLDKEDRLKVAGMIELKNGIIVYPNLFSPNEVLTSYGDHFEKLEAITLKKGSTREIEVNVPSHFSEVGFTLPNESKGLFVAVYGKDNTSLGNFDIADGSLIFLPKGEYKFVVHSEIEEGEVITYIREHK